LLVVNVLTVIQFKMRRLMRDNSCRKDERKENCKQLKFHESYLTCKKLKKKEVRK